MGARLATFLETIGAQLGHNWGATGAQLGHNWGTTGAQLERKIEQIEITELLGDFRVLGEEGTIGSHFHCKGKYRFQ